MDTVATFEAALEGQSTVHRTTADGFAEVLSAAVEEPAVGTPVPLDGISLADAGVETDPDLAAIDAARTGVTAAGLGVAEYGSITIRSSEAGDEILSLYVPRHVAVLAESDLVPDMAGAFDRLGEAFEAGTDAQVFATGPSSTADMGGLIRGVHGPHETHVVVLEDR